MSKRKEYEWRLTWSGYPDSDMLRACFKHLQVFPLFRDSKARLIDFEEYRKLIADGTLEPALSYWQIKEGEVGLITQTYFEGYTNTWDKINTAKGDFEGGWIACEKRDQFLADWDEALQLNKQWKKDRQVHSRRTEIPVLARIGERINLRAYQERYSLLSCDWKENRWGRMIDRDGRYTLIIKAKCTKAELNELASEIYYDITY